MTSRAHRLTSLLSFISLNSPQLTDLRRAHALLIVSGAITPKPIARRVVSLYCLRSIYDAALLHSQLGSPDPISSNLIVKFLVRSSQPIQVLSFFSQQVHPIGCRPSKCTFPLLVTATKLSKSGKHGKLLHCLAVKIGFMFHAPVPNSLIHIDASLDAFNHARQIFNEMPHRDIVSYNTLLSGYEKVGDLEKAENLFLSMPEDNVISWAILLKGYVRNQQFEKGLAFFSQMLILGISILGLVKEALALFTRMQVDGIKPNEDTFICLLLTCGYGGLVEGLEYFEMMNSVYGMKPTLAHCWSLLDLLVRAGWSEDRLKTVQNLPWDNQSSLWEALIRLSETSSDVSIGEYLDRKTIELEPANSMRYLPLLNLYVAASRWDRYRVV